MNISQTRGVAYFFTLQLGKLVKLVGIVAIIWSVYKYLDYKFFCKASWCPTQDAWAVSVIFVGFIGVVVYFFGSTIIRTSNKHLRDANNISTNVTPIAYDMSASSVRNTAHLLTSMLGRNILRLSFLAFLVWLYSGLKLEFFCADTPGYYSSCKDDAMWSSLFSGIIGVVCLIIGAGIILVSKHLSGKKDISTNVLAATPERGDDGLGKAV